MFNIRKIQYIKRLLCWVVYTSQMDFDKINIAADWRVGGTQNGSHANEKDSLWQIVFPRRRACPVRFRAGSLWRGLWRRLRWH